MARAVDYDDAPGRAREPLTADEVVALLGAGGRPVSRDPARVVHLLTRVEATLKAHARQVAGLHRDIDAIAATTRRKGTPLQVAVDALTELTEEQRAQVLDVVVATRLAELTQRIEDADRARLAARSEGNRVRFVLGQLTADPELPEAARAAVVAALAALPAPARTTPAGGQPTVADTAPAAPEPFQPPWPAPRDPEPATLPPAGRDPDAGPSAAPGLDSGQRDAAAQVAEAPTALRFATLEPTVEDPAWQLQAFAGESCVGSLDVAADTHTATGLAVDGPFRRRGVATALVDEARRRFPDLRPGPAGGDGELFLVSYRARTGWPS